MIKLMDLLFEGVNDPGIFKAIFLAGGPGSGKTFVAQKLFGIPDGLTTSATGLRLVNSDTEFEMLLNKYFGTIEIDKFPPEEFEDLVKSAEEGGANMRPFAKDLNKQKLKLYKKGKLGIIIDGTAHDVEKVKKDKKELEKLGYDTYMVFVNTNLEATLKRNDARERTVPVDIVKKRWNKVQKNMKITFPIVFKGSKIKAEAQTLKFSPKCFILTDDGIVHPFLYTWSPWGRLCLIFVSNILVTRKN